MIGWLIAIGLAYIAWKKKSLKWFLGAIIVFTLVSCSEDKPDPDFEIGGKKCSIKKEINIPGKELPKIYVLEEGGKKFLVGYTGYADGGISICQIN